MKKLIWKIRYAYHHNRILKAGYRLAWGEGKATLEDNFNGDTSECDPIEAVDDTVDTWRQCC